MISPKPEDTASSAHNPIQDKICKICLDPFLQPDQNKKYMSLTACDHLFHTECLSQFFEAEVSCKNIPLRCPDCLQNVLDSEVETCTTDILYEKYQRFLMQKAVDGSQTLVWCPSPDCDHFFERGSGPSVQCPKCEKTWCSQCRASDHPGSSCSEQRENKVFLALARKRKFQVCPKCNFYVERSAGCNSMVCRCSARFCYECGELNDFPGCACTRAMRAE